MAVPVVHMDALHWRLGWAASEAAEFGGRMAHAAAGERWVMQGNYTSNLDLRLPRAGAGQRVVEDTPNPGHDE